MFSMSKKNKIEFKPYYEKGKSNPKFALLTIRGDLRKAIIDRFTKQYIIEGDHLKDGGRVAPSAMLTLLGGGGASLGLSSLAAGNLFVATANPATLMTLGNGVASAVMGAGGIVAQAPFLPVAGMPLVAPILAFQALSTVILLNQFKKLNVKLDNIEDGIRKILRRMEAEYIGQILSASRRIEVLEDQFCVMNQFSRDMIIALVILEDRINPIFQRYTFLYETQPLNGAKRDDLQDKKNDAYLAVQLGILDLRIQILRLRLALQETPGYLRESLNLVQEKADNLLTFLGEIQKDYHDAEALMLDIDEMVQGLGWWKRTMPEFLGGMRSARKNLSDNSRNLRRYKLGLNRLEREEMSSVTDFLQSLKDEHEKALQQSLVYWRDEDSENSYYTNDLKILSTSQNK